MTSAVSRLVRRKSDLIVTPAGLFGFGRRFPCTIGRGGVVTDKREGDGGTPGGLLRITGLLYRADRISRPADWAGAIGPRDLWCDDPSHPLYNQPARAPLNASHETLRRADPLYDLILTTDWNWPVAVPGAGSAIFLHRWRRPGAPTEGCIALRPDHLSWIAARISPGARVIVSPQPRAPKIAEPTRT